MQDEVLEQADLTPSVEFGDVPTGEEPGQKHTSVPMVPKEDTAERSERNEEEKQKRISDAEWQENKEKANKGEELEVKIKETLQVESPDQLDAIAKKLENLEADNARKDWEMDHPIVRTEKYKEAWTEIVKKKGHLIKSGDLTYEEAWAIINREKPSSLNRELQERSQMEESSVPTTSRSSVPRKGLDPETARIAQMGGLTEEDFRRAGML